MEKQKKPLIQIISETWTKLEIVVDLCRLLFSPKDKQKTSDRAMCVIIDLTNYITDKDLKQLSDYADAVIKYRNIKEEN